MGKRLRLLVPWLCLPVSACEPFAGSDIAGPDGSVAAQDAGDSGAPPSPTDGPCNARVAPSFCSDFDGPQPLAGWRVEDYPNRSTIKVLSPAGAGAPSARNALELLVFGNAPDSGGASLTRDLGAQTNQLDCSYWFRYDTPQGPPQDIFTLIRNGDSPKPVYILLDPAGGTFGVYSNYFEPQQAPEQPVPGAVQPPGVWVRHQVRLLVDTLTVTIGAATVTKSIGSASGRTSLQLGFPARNKFVEGTPEYRVYYDNVQCTVQ